MREGLAVDDERILGALAGRLGHEAQHILQLLDRPAVGHLGGILQQGQSAVQGLWTHTQGASSNACPHHPPTMPGRKELGAP